MKTRKHKSFLHSYLSGRHSPAQPSTVTVFRAAKTIVAAILLFGVSQANAQQVAQSGAGVSAQNTDLVELRVDPNISFNRVLAPLAIGAAQTATINVTYNPTSCGTVSAWPSAAQTAFSYAASLWGTLISSPVPVEVNACWKALGSGVLGSAGATYVTRDFTNAPVPLTWYSAALANALAGSDLNSNVGDINANFSSAFTNWYFGTDGNPPLGDFDFVTVVMHEIGHGLGFSGRLRYNGITGEGELFGTSGLPGIYDQFTENTANQALLSFVIPSVALGNELIGGQLQFDGPFVRAANGNTPAQIYAPNPYNPGSSYSHLGPDFDNTINAMMTYSLSPGEVAHDPGPVGLALLQDIGWQSADPDPIITSHNPGDMLDGAVETFTWDANNSGDEFWVYLGSTQGSANYYNSGSLGSNTSVTANGLPTDGQSPVWLRLWHRTGNEPWNNSLPDTYIDVEYVAGTMSGGAIQITSPLPSTQLGTSAVLNWSDPLNSVQYWVYAGSGQGKRNYHDSGSISGGSSYTISGLPGHPNTVWVRLWYKLSISAPWQFIDQEYGASIGISPPDGSPLFNDSETFTFTGAGVTEWWLYAGTNTGLSNIANSGNLGSTNSYTVSGIDSLFGEPLFIRLWYRAGSASWSFMDYVYFPVGSINN